MLVFICHGFNSVAVLTLYNTMLTHPLGPYSLPVHVGGGLSGGMSAHLVYLPMLCTLTLYQRFSVKHKLEN